ncbi:MAG: hypothetical protein HY698_16505 [Deltaproteobacteria bacterium]|nr:hypothetical protein [Deltaproteobacteria bacterium]
MLRANLFTLLLVFTGCVGSRPDQGGPDARPDGHVAPRDGDADSGGDGDVATPDGSMADGEVAVPDAGMDAVPTPDGGTDNEADGGTSVGFMACGSAGSTDPNVFLELGHGFKVDKLSREGDRLLSRDNAGDSAGHWVLWDTSTGSQLANGSVSMTSRAVALMAKGTMVIQSSSGYELRSARNGQILATIPAASTTFGGLAADGSYLWVASTTGISAWSLSGELIMSRSGDYRYANVFAADKELRVAKSPSGSAVIERIQIPGGETSVSPTFSGDFKSWFADGERFLATISDNVVVYSKTATRDALVASEATLVGGYGDHFWIWMDLKRKLSIYKVGEATPVVTRSGWEVFPAGSMILNRSAIGNEGISKIETFRLDPAGVVESGAFEMPMWGSVTSFGSDQNGNWSIGNEYGAMVEKTVGAEMRTLGCGAVLGVAGSESGVAAVATASGQIMHIATDATGPRIRGTIPLTSSRLELSRDGAMLAVGRTVYSKNWDDRSVRVFSLATLAETYSFSSTPYTFVDFDLARGGSRIAHLEYMSNSSPRIYMRKVTAVDGADVVFSDQNYVAEKFRLSPDGTRAAVPDKSRVPRVASRIFINGVLSNVVFGYPEGWIDDNRLLVTEYTGGTIDDELVHANAKLYDAQGTLLASPALPELLSGFSFIAPNAIYTYQSNEIYDLQTGSSLWVSDNPGRDSPWQGRVTSGAIAGDHAVYSIGHRLYVERYKLN